MTIPHTPDPPNTTQDLLTGPYPGVLEGPGQATVTISATRLGELGDLLGVLDEFLRGSDGVADRLVDFYADRGHRCPGFAANNLLDQVSFTAAALRHQHQQWQQGAGR